MELTKFFKISDIVHSCVDKFNGITNKNLGDCYLLAWKFKKKSKNSISNNNININIYNNEGGKMSVEENHELADCALLGFLNIIKKINKSQKILSYRKDPDLIKKSKIFSSNGIWITYRMGNRRSNRILL